MAKGVFSRKYDPIPKDWPVQPVNRNEIGHNAKLDVDIATDGYCGLSWDDGIITSMTPAPSARCPFEAFHRYDGRTA